MKYFGDISLVISFNKIERKWWFKNRIGVRILWEFGDERLKIVARGIKQIKDLISLDTSRRATII